MFDRTSASSDFRLLSYTSAFGTIKCLRCGVYKKEVAFLFIAFVRNLSHPATSRCGDVVTTSLCTSQQRRRYVSNETPNYVSVVHHQDISVIRFNVVPLVRLKRCQ